MKIINKSFISLSLIALISFCASCNKNQESFSTNKEDSKETYAIGEPEYTILDDKELDINVDPSGFEIIDLFNDGDFNKQASDKYYKWATSDPIHPKKAGYLEWW